MLEYDRSNGKLKASIWISTWRGNDKNVVTATRLAFSSLQQSFVADCNASFVLKLIIWKKLQPFCLLRDLCSVAGMYSAGNICWDIMTYFCNSGCSGSAMYSSISTSLFILIILQFSGTLIIGSSSGRGWLLNTFISTFILSDSLSYDIEDTRWLRKNHIYEKLTKIEVNLGNVAPSWEKNYSPVLVYLVTFTTC